MGENFRFFILFDGLAVNVSRKIPSNKYENDVGISTQMKRTVYLMPCIFGISFVYMNFVVESFFTIHLSKEKTKKINWKNSH